MLRRSERYSATPVLVISTEASERDIERALELGANAFLAKPFHAEALLLQVQQLLKA